eukprot:TRINITY_DN1674_c8_g5_i1.p2 TRINITY_DN1674_c8_g5~~TRINITY_DN1674_c8_g5_i1.p2  ORF type:complete len:101 (-),score=8.57 TRINITY_DN1674_c8_g5_i1:566-868(-)
MLRGRHSAESTKDPPAPAFVHSQRPAQRRAGGGAVSIAAAGGWEIGDVFLLFCSCVCVCVPAQRRLAPWFARKPSAEEKKTGTDNKKTMKHKKTKQNKTK